MALKIISAGAGSGKTYRLTEELVSLLATGQARASNIIATTFTEKAAAELRERVRVKLLERKMLDAANALPNALIGTVHSVGAKLLRRFAFEAGVSPLLDIVPDGEFQSLFNRSLATVITPDEAEQMEQLVEQLGFARNSDFDWRTDVLNLTNLARANDITPDMWVYSRNESFASLSQFYGERSTLSAQYWNNQLRDRLFDTIQAIEGNGDETKTTLDVLADLKKQYRELQQQGSLPWYVWAKLGKDKVGKKSGEAFEVFREWVTTHGEHPDFHDQNQAYINGIFDIGQRAIGAYEGYKKQRGLIDYTDMEVLLRQLIGRADIRAILADELDLLMVDEFQDTNPIQLDIFTQLSRLATHSVWVGDPKQSIYSFRGADPRLMQAVIDQSGGIAQDDILRDSWRSRPDIVHFTNAYFTEAFRQMPPDQVTLAPKRTDKEGMSSALVHWHFEAIADDNKRHPAKPWLERCIAQSVREMLENPPIIEPKGGTGMLRAARAGDVAILCSRNDECATIAEALNYVGIKAAIARTGLLGTAEATLIVACLRYLYTRRDSLAVAEIQLLANRQPIENILTERLDYLAQHTEGERTDTWAESAPILTKLNTLRRTARDLSAVEVLSLILEELDLRRIVAAWGNMGQRLDNIEKIRQNALMYEQACLRNHSAASLAGFLVWLKDSANNGRDEQSAAESADTVRVLTYHRSKGLEFPITICHSLAKKTKDGIWGLHIEQTRTELDLDNVLDGLWIRFWINPYERQSAKTPLVERLATSQYQIAATAHALREDGRVLYVGITRARDYLILPTAKEPARWFNRVYLHGNEDAALLDQTNSTNAFEPLVFDLQNKQYPRDIAPTPMPEEQISYLQQRVGKQDPAYQKYIIDLRQDTHEIKARVVQANIHTFATAEIPQPQPLSALAFRTIRGMFLADHNTTTIAARAEIANQLSTRFMAHEAIKIADLMRISQAWWTTIAQKFPHDRIYRLYPIRHYRGQQIFETAVELLRESPEQLTVVYLHAYPIPTSAAARVRDVAAWMLLTTEALRQIFPNRTIRQVVVFPLAGVWADVKIV